VVSDEPMADLYTVLALFILPSAVLFYLNNAITRWREVYADIRTVAFQRTDRYLLTLFRFIYPIKGESLTTRLLSPFILTVDERIRVLREGPFNRLIERISLCVAITAASIVVNMFAFYSPSYPWPSMDIVTLLWACVHMALTSIMALPHWLLFISKMENKRECIMSIFLNPLKLLAVIGAPFLVLVLTVILPVALYYPWLMDYRIFEYFFIGFILGGYAFLFLQELVFWGILCIVGLSIRARTKVLLSEAPLLFMVFIFTLSYVLKFDAFPFFLATGLTLSLFLGIFNFRYSKCPYCSSDIDLHQVLQCPNCLHRLNEEFMIYLDGYK